MTARKIKINDKINEQNSIDFYNFCNANNDLPILEVLNERFSRSFRVTFSNYLRVISNTTHTQDKITFEQWRSENSNLNCIFIIKLKGLNSPILVKFDRVLSYGALDTLSGGSGEDYRTESEKEMTSIELSILKNLGLKLIQDLNESWAPIYEIKAEYVRTEVNADYVGIVSPTTKMIRVTHEVEFLKNKGKVEVIYPYSTLFPLRDKLYRSE